VEAELVLQPGRTNQTVAVRGVPDLLDDGAQQFAISVGPCKSSDTRFNFDGVRERVASGWNEDHGFPLVEEIEPTQSAMLGESITIQGRNLNPQTGVCVNGIYVSGRPDYRVSLAIASPSGDATAFEVTLRSAAAVQWFENVSGTEYRPYAPKACPQLAVRRRVSVRVAGGRVSTATATANTGATNQAANALARSAAKGVDIKSVRFGVIDGTNGPTDNASSYSTDGSGLDIPGTLIVADLEFDVTAVSSMPTEPLLNQARTQLSSARFACKLLTPPMQARVASLNTTLSAKFFADLGIAYNFSDSGSASSGNEASIEAVTGHDTATASLTVDFVQRFNFSATEGGAISFRSPKASAEGYASMIVFDKAGANSRSLT
jgi:hypothetical protein